MHRTFTAGAGRAVQQAANLANENGSPVIEPIHLLCALVLDESRAAALMTAHGLDRSTIQSQLPASFHDADSADSPNDEAEHPRLEPSTDLQNVLIEANSCLNRKSLDLELGSEHLLWGLAAIPSAASALLKQHGIDRSVIPIDSGREEHCDPITVDFELQTETTETTGIKDKSQPDADIARILDAAANRAREGIRVVEDYVRFVLDDGFLTRMSKECRHDLTAILNDAGIGEFVSGRDTTGDVGTRISTDAESVRDSPFHVVAANLKRAQGALRSLEEFGKCLSTEFGCRIESVRYRLYTLEKAVRGAARNGERFTNCRLYWLLTQAAITGDIEQSVKAALNSGVDVLQIREKTLADAELLQWARTLREWTRETGALLIMNDRPDLALLSQADGVHVGQEELSVSEARRIVGPRMLIGVSTHNINQARKAVIDGADYLGVGPVFPSRTKSFDSFAGLEFVRQVAAEISLPWFAIGGIDANNIAEVTQAGATRIAVGNGWRDASILRKSLKSSTTEDRR